MLTSDCLTIETLPEAEKFVNKQRNLGNDVRWENYDIVFFRPAEQGIYSKDGAFRNGVWGFENRSPINDNGAWEIDWRNVRRSKPARS